jgi:4-coumarate--CoA ligase
LENELAYAFKISNASHILVHPSSLKLALLTLVSDTLGFTEAEAKRRVIVIANKKDVSKDVQAQGWATLDDIVTGVKPLARPEPFDGEQSLETAAIFYSSGMTEGIFTLVTVSHD